MINTNSIDTIASSRFKNNLVKPLYNSYCFSNIPQTIRRLLGLKYEKALPDDTLKGLKGEYKKVFLFFIDAFGWHLLDKHKNSHPFFKRIIDNGVASKITSLFPSTTAAHVTTMHTGRQYWDHGIYEWYFYEPEIDDLFSPFMYCKPGEEPQSLKINKNLDPSKIFPQKTFYQDLKVDGVGSRVYIPQEYLGSPYNVTTGKGSKLNGYSSLHEALEKLGRDALNSPPNNLEYYHMYYPKVDSLSHEFGWDSEECTSEVNFILNSLEEVFYNKYFTQIKNSIIIMIADHGQTIVPQSNKIYLNLHLPEIVSYIKRNNEGKLLVPGGEARCMLLYLNDSKNIHQVKKLIHNKLEGKVDAYTPDELLQEKIFANGKDITEKLQRRLPELILLPRDSYGVWWYEEGKFEIQRGNHGGLSPKEMESIFLVMES